MMRDDIEDDGLRAGFAALAAEDAREAPAFGPMLARARAAVPSASGQVPSVAATPSRRAWRWAALAAPLAVAASLAIVWLAPSRPTQDDEFERVVSEWSRTERAMATPTDGLLAVPGSEYLRRLPAFPTAGATRRPS